MLLLLSIPKHKPEGRLKYAIINPFGLRCLARKAEPTREAPTRTQSGNTWIDMYSCVALFAVGDAQVLEIKFAR
jgi:hypothetical protein